MPLDVMNIVASQVILRNSANPPNAGTTARASVAAGLVTGPMGLVVPIIVARQQPSGGGGSSEGVIVPDVVKESEAEAKTELEGSRLKVTARRAYSAETEKGTVVSQNPPAGALRPLGSAVEITVSDGPPPEGTPDDDGEFVTKAEFEAGMKSVNDKLDQIIKAQGGGTGFTPGSGTSPTSSSTSGSATPTATRSRST